MPKHINFSFYVVIPVDFKIYLTTINHECINSKTSLTFMVIVPSDMIVRICSMQGFNNPLFEA